MEGGEYSKYDFHSNGASGGTTRCCSKRGQKRCARKARNRLRKPVRRTNRHIASIVVPIARRGIVGIVGERRSARTVDRAIAIRHAVIPSRESDLAERRPGGCAAAQRQILERRSEPNHGDDTQSIASALSPPVTRRREPPPNKRQPSQHDYNRWLSHSRGIRKTQWGSRTNSGKNLGRQLGERHPGPAAEQRNFER